MLDLRKLEELVSAGATVSAIARACSVNETEVRHALGDAGLVTLRQQTLRASRAARNDGVRELRLACPTHGVLEHRVDTRGTFRCPKCNAMRVAQRRRTVKERLIAEAGGACRLCGYARSSRALSFHHVDPSTKSFGLAVGGISRSLEKARAEAAKCILLCANCHMEVEEGVRAISLE